MMMRGKAVITAVFFIIPLFFAGAAEAKFVHACVYLVQTGDVDKKVVDKIKEKLPLSVPITIRVEVDQKRDLPQAAYDPSRKQYNAQAVMDDISDRIRLAITNERALIIVDADLYAPGSDFIIGMADPKKGMAIMSLTRLKNEFYGLAPDRRLFNDRVLKEAVHQLGKSWNMPDCPSPKCPMNLSDKMSDVDKERDTLCYKCRIAMENIFIGGTLMGEKIKKK